jgi:hypothetical protein
MRLIRPVLVRAACLGLALVASGCGGSSEEAKDPSEAPSEAPAEKSTPSAEKPADSETSDDKKTESKEAPADPEPDTKRSLKDILTREDVMFVFAFSASEPFQAAEKTCIEKSNDDPKKKSECMAKASAKYDIDMLSFEKDDEGKYWYVTSVRKGDTLKTLHKIPVDFGDEKGTSITIKPTGRDKGPKPLANPKDVVIDVPSESEIVLTDPRHGKMVYQAKMGMKGR